jgi:hypothetical protein
MFPSLSQYNKVIQQQANTFKTLTGLFFVPAKTLPIKFYNFGSGSYAVVFKALENSKEIAIRCFLGSDNDYVERYRKIDNYLRDIDESWKVNIQFLDNEIKVDGRYYPVLKMDWVDGKLLDKFISDNLYENKTLTKLQEELVKTSNSLEQNKIAHGDIQCGNIIVIEINGKPQVKLIDYDGLYIPDFIGEQEKERGRSEFQHPNRSFFGFNERMDRFSFWVLLCAIEALKFDKRLWEETTQGGFNTLDNVLFVGSDFSNPSESKLFNRFHNLNQPSLNFYIDKIKLALNTSNIDKLIIYGQSENIKERPPVTKSKASSVNYLPIHILSIPSGASVRDEDFKNIGNTPITLDRNKFLNTSIKIILGTELKSIVIDQFTKDINIDFNVIILPPKPPNPPSTPKPPIPEPPVLPTPPTNYSRLIIVTIIAVLLSILTFVIYFKNDELNSYPEVVDSESDFIVDTTAVAVDSTYDYGAVDYDSTSAAIEPLTEIVNSDNSPSVINSNSSNNQNTDNLKLNSTYYLGSWSIGKTVYRFLSNGDFYYKIDNGNYIWNRWTIDKDMLFLGLDQNSEVLSEFYIISRGDDFFSFKESGSTQLYTAYRLGN